jgi:tRNA(Ile)-lysidine synthase
MLPSRVAQTIRERSMLSPGERLLVAVSGGPDSTALLSILRDLVPTFAFNLRVAHFDHGWREDSALDARFVSELATRWGYRAIVGQAPLNLPRTEDAARTARYAFFREAAAAENCAAIVLGHTQDDQVETILLHLLRGSGAHGLAGMRHRSADLARPLLDVTRADIELYLRDHNLTARQDPSNEQLEFTRNRLRHVLLPALDAFDPAARRLLARTAELLAEDDRELEEQARQLSPDLIDDRAAFRALPVALQRRLIRRLHPGFNLVQVDGLRRSIAAGTGTGARVSPSLRVAARPCDCDISTFKARDPVAHVDADRLVLPLNVQQRQPGDRLQPLGFPHEKKLQDILVDARVPRHLRDSLPIVHDRAGIVWVVGVTVNESRKVTPRTSRQLHLEIVSDPVRNSASPAAL